MGTALRYASSMHLAYMAAALALAGCGAAPAASEATQPTTSNSSASSGEGTGQAPLTSDECGQMSDHMLHVRVDEMTAADPATTPGPKQLSEIRAKLRPDFIESCLAEGFSRQTFVCWMKATTVAALRACAGDGVTIPATPDS